MKLTFIAFFVNFFRIEDFVRVLEATSCYFPTSTSIIIDSRSYKVNRQCTVIVQDMNNKAAVYDHCHSPLLLKFYFTLKGDINIWIRTTAIAWLYSTNCYPS